MNIDKVLMNEINEGCQKAVQQNHLPGQQQSSNNCLAENESSIETNYDIECQAAAVTTVTCSDDGDDNEKDFSFSNKRPVLAGDNNTFNDLEVGSGDAKSHEADTTTTDLPFDNADSSLLGQESPNRSTCDDRVKNDGSDCASCLSSKMGRNANNNNNPTNTNITTERGATSSSASVVTTAANKKDDYQRRLARKIGSQHEKDYNDTSVTDDINHDDEDGDYRDSDNDSDSWPEYRRDEGRNNKTEKTRTNESNARRRFSNKIDDDTDDEYERHQHQPVRNKNNNKTAGRCNMNGHSSFKKSSFLLHAEAGDGPVIFDTQNNTDQASQNYNDEILPGAYAAEGRALGVNVNARRRYEQQQRQDTINSGNESREDNSSSTNLVRSSNASGVEVVAFAVDESNDALTSGILRDVRRSIIDEAVEAAEVEPVHEEHVKFTRYSLWLLAILLVVIVGISVGLTRWQNQNYMQSSDRPPITPSANHTADHTPTIQKVIEEGKLICHESWIKPLQVDLCRAVAVDVLGKHAKIEIIDEIDVPWSQAFDALRNGTVDILFLWTHNMYRDVIKASLMSSYISARMPI